MYCECEFEPGPGDPDGEPPWHFKRACEACGGVWWSLHCAHDGHQTGCHHCGHVHRPIPEEG